MALRLWLILRGWPDLDSDVAILGLMARHIVYNGASPLFYYGQHYNGPLDAYLPAAAFLLLGPTTLAVNLAALPLLAIFLVAMYALGRAAYGPTVGLLTLAYLALGPALGLLLGIVYPVFGVVNGLGALLLLLVYARLRRPEPLPVGRTEWAKGLVHYAAIGLVIGLGLWSAQLIVTFVLAALIALVLGRTRETLHLPGLALVMGSVAGSWPMLVYNFQHGGVTFAEVTMRLAVPIHAGRIPPFIIWVIQAAMALAVGLPAIFGSPHVCVSQSGTWPAYPPTLAEMGTQPGGACDGLNVLFALCILTCYLFVARQSVGAGLGWLRARLRGIERLPIVWRVGRAAVLKASDAESARRVAAEEIARTWLRAMLVLVAVTTIALYTTNAATVLYPLLLAKYLLPLYVTVPLVLGALWQPVRLIAQPSAVWLARLAQPAMRWRAVAGGPRETDLGDRGHPSAGSGMPGGVPTTRDPEPVGQRAVAHAEVRQQAVRGLFAIAALALLLGFVAYGTVRSVERATDTSLFALPAPPADQRLMAVLAAHGITRFTSDYWTCYRLAFESGEQLHCAVRNKDGSFSQKGTVNRYWPYVVELQHTLHPAYIYAPTNPENIGIDDQPDRQSLPSIGYVQLVSDGYTIYYFPGGQD